MVYACRVWVVVVEAHGVALLGRGHSCDRRSARMYSFCAVGSLRFGWVEPFRVGEA